MKTKVRNPIALGAALRSGAGFHKDSRKGRGGNRNVQADFLEELEAEIETEVSGSHGSVSMVQCQ